MTKFDMAYIITNSPAWDGCSMSQLMKFKKELKDIYDQIDEAEKEYYSCSYGWR